MALSGTLPTVQSRKLDPRQLKEHYQIYTDSKQKNQDAHLCSTLSAKSVGISQLARHGSLKGLADSKSGTFSSQNTRPSSADAFE